MSKSKKRSNQVGLTWVLAIGLMVSSLGLGVPLTEAAPPTKSGCSSSTGSSWDQKLTGDCRFTVLTDFGGAAVRDNNTGLVWEQTPGGGTSTWAVAARSCLTKEIGGTRGWRLPSLPELASVMDPSLPPPYVPANIFTGVQSLMYWSASTVADNPSYAWAFGFGQIILPSGGIGSGAVDGTRVKAEPSAFTWCVRGPMQQSVY